MEENLGFRVCKVETPEPRTVKALAWVNLEMQQMSQVCAVLPNKCLLATEQRDPTAMPCQGWNNIYFNN